MGHSLTPAYTIQEQISFAAFENKRLCHLLREKDYAPSAICESNSRICDLRKRLEAKRCKASLLGLDQEKLQAEHRWYQTQSGVVRFGYTLMGKNEEFERKVADAEERFQEAARNRTETVKEAKELEADLEKAMETLEREERAEKMRVDALNKLDTLYDSIFQGRTPEFPEEDLAEDLVTEWKEKLEKARPQLEKKRSIFKTLKSMKTELLAADSILAHVERLGRGLLRCEDDNRRLLSKAREHVDETTKLLRQARELNPGMRTLGSMYIPSISSLQRFRDGELSGVDDIFTIKRARTRLESVMGELKAEKKIAKKKVWRNVLEIENLEESLKEKEESLREVRRGVFNKITEGVPGYGPEWETS